MGPWRGTACFWLRCVVGDFGKGGGTGGGTGRGGSGVLARDTGYRAWAIMSPCGSEGTY